MASPFRSWSFRSHDAPRRRVPLGLSRGAGGSRVEPLEDRRLLAASLVSLASSSLAGANADSLDPDISSTGRYVVFASRASDLVPEDVNTTFDVYYRDLQTGVTRLVSVSTAGAAGNGASVNPTVSDDGRFVAFSSDASNLVAGDNNAVSDVFVRDMFTNETRLVSMNVLGTGPGNGVSFQPAISGNGQFVAFTSDASNVAANDPSTTRDVFIRNLQTNTTSLVSVGITGVGGDAASQSPAISTNGSFIAFNSEATNLPGAGVGAAGPDVYLRDTTAATTVLVSTTDGLTGGSVDASTAPSVSDNGRYVAFASPAADLVAGDTNGVSDVFRKDLNTSAVVLVSQNSASEIGNGASINPKISADGRYVAFSSTASNMASPDSGTGPDVFLRDLDGATTLLVSTNLTGNGGTGSSSQAAITGDATLVAFVSGARNVVAEATTGTNVFLATPALPGIDIAAPTLYVPPQPAAPQRPQVGNTFLPFTVIYDDDVAIDPSTFGNIDLVVTGPNGFSETATFFSLTSTTGRSATVNYTVPAPGGDLSAADNGTYIVTVRGQQIGDRARNFIATAAAGTFVLDLPVSETVLPVPTFVGGSPAVGSATYEFTVIYSERGGIDFATFGDDDVQVSGPNGFNQTATFVASTPTSATTTNVVYRITAPAGVWTANDVGAYTVSILPGGVVDQAGNAVPAGLIGTFAALGADLIAIPLRNLRSGAISGVDLQRARVRILNQGSFATTVPVAVTLFASTDTTLDPGDATIGTFIEERPIEPDRFRELRVRFTYPQVAEGNYYILSQVDSSNAVIEQSETNNVAASFKQVGLSTPFVDLVPTLVPFSGNRSRLGTNNALIRIRNAGNVAAEGDLMVALSAISDVTPVPQERAVADVPIRVSLKPGESRMFRLPFTYPIEFERGTYRLVATIDSTNVIGERDEINNRVLSLSSFSFA